MLEIAADEVAVLLEEAAESAGLVREVGLTLRAGPADPVRVRRRGMRYDIDDMGGAVAVAGRPPGWREAAERAVAELGWNVSRDGVVFVQAVEGRDIDSLVRRTGETSAAVLEALLALQDSSAHAHKHLCGAYVHEGRTTHLRAGPPGPALERGGELVEPDRARGERAPVDVAGASSSSARSTSAGVWWNAPRTSSSS